MGTEEKEKLVLGMLWSQRRWGKAEEMMVESGFGFLKELFTFVGEPGCLLLALHEMAHTGGARKALLRVQAGMSGTWAD